MQYKFVFIWVLITMSNALAQSSGGIYEIKTHTTDSGSQEVSGGSFSIKSTFAQPDTSTANATGGNYVLSAGYWNSFDDDLIFKNGFEG